MKRTPEEEVELAAFYDAHINDRDRWGEPVEPPPETRGRRLGATITVRFSVEEAEQIRLTARKLRRTYSDIVRDAVREYTQPERSITAAFAGITGSDLSEKLTLDERMRRIELIIGVAARRAQTAEMSD